MRRVCTLFLLFLWSICSYAQAPAVTVQQDNDGWRLMVGDEPMMINGMNWDYFPIGTNYNYSLWKQSDDLIQAALDKEMSLLKNMGINSVRMYTGVPARWITYIYENYGIYTMLNHSFGRYGLTLDGAWVANTEYSDPRVRTLLLTEVNQMVEDYKNTPGLLLFLLGNENNYGLFWEGAETENIPIEDRKSTIRAQAMYQLFNEAAVSMKAIDDSHPVAICNGDLLFLDIIAAKCTDVDILGTNMYRGISFGDAFERVKREYGKPLLFTEFGSDAFSATDNQEDQYAQAYYLVGNWEEIYANAAGLGKTGNSIGGYTFQFSDGWWKYGQTKNLKVHDNNASWSNGGYESDYVEGENNMNEEWFGICAKGPTNERGLYSLYPRAAYYALQHVHNIDPLDPTMTKSELEDSFDDVQLMDAILRARGDKAALEASQTSKLGISSVEARFTTFSTGGNRISTPKEDDPNTRTYPDELGFDHMQSFFVGVAAHPSPEIQANVKFNVLGNVAENPIDEIFYENRGRRFRVATPDGPADVSDGERLRVYSADFKWNHSHFELDGFYRTGHYHWGYEGDFFGLYPEANYGPNMDIYNGNAPLGVEIAGKKFLDGLKIAAGPELWWGANPAILLKYRKRMGEVDLTAIFHEDLDDPDGSVSSFAIPQPRTRRATLVLERQFNKVGVQVGGIWAGQPLVDREFQIVTQEGNDYTVYKDQVRPEDTWGAKIKFTYTGGRFNWYAQGAAMGLVANGGGDWTRTFTGWRLRENGSGNKVNLFTGFTYNIGDFQIAPNFMWQQPIVDPIPLGAPAPARARNIIDDPFVVRGSRETTAGELLLTYDPTPATWMYEWNNDEVEDARFAMSTGIVFRHFPTTQDAAIGILADGRSLFPFAGAPPAEDLWEAHARVVSKLNPDLGFIANIYGGNAQARGSDPRLIQRFGADLRMIYKKLKVVSMVKVDDWGPYDYHRDFNLTFPLQLTLDLSTTAGKPSWFMLPTTRLGVRATWRSLDGYSNRYCPTTSLNVDGDVVCNKDAIGFDNGNEWEIRTYVHFNIGR